MTPVCKRGNLHRLSGFRHPEGGASPNPFDLKDEVDKRVKQMRHP